MKAFSESTANSGPLQRVRCTKSKVQKRSRQSREMEANKKEEQNIKEYLDKLQEIVPSLPKNKKLNKVEVIDHVIEYIHELRGALGLPQCCNNDNLPCNNTFSMEAIILGRKQRQQSPFHSL